MSDTGTITPVAEHQGKIAAALVWLIYIAGVFTAGLLSPIGVIVAYVVRGESTGWVRTHFDAQVRLFWSTLWLGLAVAVLIGISAILSIVVIGIPFLILFGILWFVVMIWFLVKSVFGMLNLLKERPA